MKRWKDAALKIAELKEKFEALADEMENEGPTNRAWYLEVREILETFE